MHKTTTWILIPIKRSRKLPQRKNPQQRPTSSRFSWRRPTHIVVDQSPVIQFTPRKTSNTQMAMVSTNGNLPQL
ncbi:hypothetical protein YC2023_060813 [Brassica napus]